MQVKEKTGTITEPVTLAEVALYVGYSGTDQNALFTQLITAARKWIENHFAFSCVSKSYIVRFEKSDAVDGWYELPVSPVISITSAAIDSIDVDYEEKGDETRFINSDEVMSTGTSSNELVVEFIAGAADDMAKTGIIRIVSDMFNNKDDSPENINAAKLSYDTMRFLEGLNHNTGL